ncbi:3-hydroxyacyl-CoA dehydrogenase NAD-binding domain-containing protein [Rickettsiales bacterium]|nr:3-hydroxyacyl-CoA dehydrogenase NAD-binding domain-containing protein [Rickettsiales bacterium]
MSQYFDFKIDNKGLAKIVFDQKGEKVNKLSSKVLSLLSKTLKDAAKNKNIKTLTFVSKKDNIFIAGADINEIKDIKNEKDALKKVTEGQNILNQIENLPFPTIALINGACLGGGLELALACKYRIATDNNKTKLGLPEVNLGIIPGFGGTQRLPKIIGLQHSVAMILSGKAIDHKKAYKVGLADEITKEEFSDDCLNNFIEKILEKPKRNTYLIKRQAQKRSRFTKENLLLGKILIYKIAKKNLIAKTRSKYPAPLAALEVIKETYDLDDSDILKGLQIEANYFAKLASKEVAKNLIDLFFASEEVKKFSPSDNKKDIKDIKNTGLIGAGIMGGGIAWLFSNYNIAIRMKDISNQGIALGFKQIHKIYSQLKKIRKYSDSQINLRINKISSSLDYKGFKDKDLVVEAIIEDIDIKKRAISELENYIANDAIIASNTSSLSITKMAKSLKNPERFIGMHFFNPVNRMPLVEVIKGTKTSNQAIATIVNISKKLGKTPIIVKDVPGFLVNRILIPYINESALLVEEGADIELVDELIYDFGMPMGPFTLADEVGIDVGYKVAKILEEGYGNRMQVCHLLKDIYENKEMWGKKTSQGFFNYDKKGKKLNINPKIAEIIKNSALRKSKFFEEDVIDRCILIMINEAARCLEENVVENAKFLDIAMIMGTGFPPFRGGLLKYADNIGIKKLFTKMQKLHKKYGKRFEPAQLIVKMAKDNKKFYENTRN